MHVAAALTCNHLAGCKVIRKVYPFPFPSPTALIQASGLLSNLLLDQSPLNCESVIHTQLAPTTILTVPCSSSGLSVSSWSVLPLSDQCIREFVHLLPEDVL